MKKILFSLVVLASTMSSARTIYTFQADALNLCFEWRGVGSIGGVDPLRACMDTINGKTFDSAKLYSCSLDAGRSRMLLHEQIACLNKIADKN